MGFAPSTGADLGRSMLCGSAVARASGLAHRLLHTGKVGFVALRPVAGTMLLPAPSPSHGTCQMSCQTK